MPAFRRSTEYPYDGPVYDGPLEGGHIAHAEPTFIARHFARAVIVSIDQEEGLAGHAYPVAYRFSHALRSWVWVQTAFATPKFSKPAQERSDHTRGPSSSPPPL